MKLLARFALAAALVAAAALAPAGRPAARAASPAPSDDASPSAADKAVQARATEWIGRLQRRDIDRSQLTPELSAAMTDAVLDSISSQLKPLGTPTAVTPVARHDADTYIQYTYHVSWPKGAFYESFAVTKPGGKVAGIYFRPAPSAVPSPQQ